MSTNRSTAATLIPCRFCGTHLEHVFVDLGMSPLCQTHIETHQLNQMEPFFPLRVFVCGQCHLVQLQEYVAPKDIFTEYAYFSSFSESWLEHCRKYCEMMISKFALNASSRVVEIASNDGYLLQFFAKAGVPVLGIEPAKNVAAVARDKGVPTVSEFLGQDTATKIVAEHGKADLVLGNNVLAHVPAINDFVKGMRVLLKDDGLLTMEFPHLVELMRNNQFDTIYHEHFSYLSFTTVEKIFAAHGMRLFDVEKLPTHGGSIRIYGTPTTNAKYPTSERVTAIKQEEDAYGISTLAAYDRFAQQVQATKRDLLDVLIGLKRQGKKIVGYGAPGKGNTLLNYCGIRQDFLDYTVDRNPYKQGKYTPGTHIPILDPKVIKETRPDYVLILPWNLRDEVMEQNRYIREWGGRFIVPIPKAEII